MASSPTETRRYSIDDLDDFPDDGKLRELVDGRIVEWEVTNQGHGALTVLLSSLLHTFVRARRLGRVTVGDAYVRIQGSRHDVRGGDIEFFRRGRWPQDAGAAATLTVPDFVVEILSPSDRAKEVDAKVRDWLRAGVRLLWYINPLTGITTVYQGGEVRQVEAADLLDGGEVVPGFQVRLRELLDELAESDAGEG